MLKTKDGSFHTADIVVNSFILKPENVTLSKMCDFNLLFFKGTYTTGTSSQSALEI